MTATQDIGVTEISELDSARARFRDELIEAELLVPSSVEGLYGRSGEFEDIIDTIDDAVKAAGDAEHGYSAPRFRFPPVFPREAFERTDYIASFPNLTGAINTFDGDNKAHAALLADRSEGRDWDHHLESAGTMLVSAACHPSYSMMTGRLPEEGRLLDIYGYCFRHEPAVDPARMQAFRMHEYVRVGTPDEAVAHRER